jgi:hypothetical protein
LSPKLASFQAWTFVIYTRSVFSVWILKQKGHSNQWSNLLGDPSHSIIEWVLKYSNGRFLRKLAHSEKIREINVKLIISNKYFNVFSLINCFLFKSCFCLSSINRPFFLPNDFDSFVCWHKVQNCLAKNYVSFRGGNNCKNYWFWNSLNFYFKFT